MGDWGSTQYIISQIFIIFAYVCLFVTYLIKKRRLQLGIVITSNVLMGAGFIFLGAWVGLAMCAVAICRDIVSEILDHKRSETDRKKITRLDWGLLAIWCSALIGLTFATEDGIVTWFALFATLTFTVSIWQKNELIYKALGVLVGIFWIIYNVGVESVFGVILESVLLVGVIIGLSIYIVRSRKTLKADKTR